MISIAYRIAVSKDAVRRQLSLVVHLRSFPNSVVLGQNSRQPISSVFFLQKDKIAVKREQSVGYHLSNIVSGVGSRRRDAFQVAESADDEK